VTRLERGDHAILRDLLDRVGERDARDRPVGSVCAVEDRTDDRVEEIRGR
jgi:hypothetical protein